jgi:hypothetical protein
MIHSVGRVERRSPASAPSSIAPVEASEIFAYADDVQRDHEPASHRSKIHITAHNRPIASAEKTEAWAVMFFDCQHSLKGTL